MSNLVSFEQAKKLKELGFDYGDGNDRTYYHKNGKLVTYQHWDYYNDCPDDPLDSDIPAPTVPSVLQWIREKKRIICAVDVDYFDGWYYTGKYLDKSKVDLQYTNSFDDHFNAESALLEEILAHLEKQKI